MIKVLSLEYCEESFITHRFPPASFAAEGPFFVTVYEFTVFTFA